MLPCRVVCNYPVQVLPVVVVQVVSIDSLQEQVRTFRGESREVRVFLWGVGVPPHASDLDRGPPWGLFIPVPLLILLCLLFLLLCSLLLSLYGLMAFLVSISTPVGGVVGCFLILPLSSFPSCPRHLSLPSCLYRPVPLPLGYFEPIGGGSPGFGHYVGHPPAKS